MTFITSLVLALSFSFSQPSGLGTTSDRYTVEALDTGGSGRAARVIVSNRTTGRRHMVSINSTLGELRRIHIREDEGRVLFLCADGFTVVDPTGHVPADEVYASDAVVSPDGRWIAYRRFFPSTHPGPSDGVAVYDTRQPVEANHAAHPIAEEREWRAGWPVFPPSEKWTDASRVTPRADAYALTSSLTWEGGKARPILLFSMRHGSEELVVIGVPGDGAPRACWAVLPGGAEPWRVKTLDLTVQASGARLVRAKSGAVGTATETSIEFASDCSGRNP